MPWYRFESEKLILKLYLQPGGKKNAVVGLMGEELKIKLAALPIEGRANAALLKYLAELFQVPKSNILLKSGENSRHKSVEIRGTAISPESILQMSQSS